MPSNVISSDRFEASVEVLQGGRVLKYRLFREGHPLSFSAVLDLWENDVEFVNFYVSLLKQSMSERIVWETPAISKASAQKDFEFVILVLPKDSRRPDHETFADYFDTENAREGIVAFENLGRDALLIVPSPYREDTNYSGLAEFLRKAPINQQRRLWSELGRIAKSRLSDRPVWLSVSGDGVYWLHLRLDNRPKYYRYLPYKMPG